MMNDSWLSYPLVPGLLLIAAGLLMGFVRGRWLQLLVILMPIIAGVQLWSYTVGATWACSVAGFDLQLLHVTSAGRLFATAFLFALGLGGLFALQSARRVELASAFIYGGSAVSVTLCGDLISVFIFWEVMALSSTMVIWSAGGEASRRAGMRYLLVHLFGGVVLLAGVAGLVATGVDLSLGTIQGNSLSRWLVLAGFLVNAGAPPLSYWIADAYPASSPSGMVFLAAFTTKTAVYVLLSYFAGEALLIPIGLYMAVYGAVYALRETNVRRILAYSVVNQVGFMVVAVGIGTATALNGATAHAFAHIMYKTVLVMGAGSVLLSVGADQASVLGGLARRMPWTALCVVVGGAASMGVPLTSSFVTKSLILQAASEQHLLWPWLLLTVCSAAVVFNAGVRFPWLTFFQPQQSEVTEGGCDPNVYGKVALGIGATMCVVLGVFAQSLYQLLPFAGSYHPYSMAHVVEQFQLLLPAILLFFVTLPLFSLQPHRQLDFDWFLRKPLLVVWQDFVLQLFALGLRGRSFAVSSMVRGFKFVFRHHGPHGVLSRSWPTGSIALWVAILLASYVVLFNL